MEKIYVAYYSEGSYDDYRKIIVFASTDKRKVTKWCTKFNKILKKWQDYYSQYETKNYGYFKWIGDEYVDLYFNRWHFLKSVNKANYYEIELR